MTHGAAYICKLIIWNIPYEAKRKELTENWAACLRHKGIVYALLFASEMEHWGTIMSHVVDAPRLAD